MIIVMRAEVAPDSEAVRQVVRTAERFPDVRTQVGTVRGATRTVTEVYLLGSTGAIPQAVFEGLSDVEKVIRIRERYRAIGRHEDEQEAFGFTYQGLRFSQDTFHLFPGLCAIDTRENVRDMFAALRALGIRTTRGGAYKPRTSPYDFQGHGKDCLPYVFELAGAHDIKVIATRSSARSSRPGDPRA
jgi:3-deoxy-7-phosphoheptulonate synthase